MVKFLQALISKFFSAFTQAYFNYLSQQAGIAGNTILQLVHDLEQDTTLTGAQKAEKLLQQLKNLAISTGKEVSTSTLNLIIEVALKVIRGGA